MKEKITKNLQMNLIFTFGAGILGFIVNKFFARYNGMEMLGLMKLFTQMVAYLNLAELGIGTASAYALYKPLADKDYDKINIIVSTINEFYKKLTIAILVVGGLCSLSLPYFIKLESFSIKIYFYWILYVINVAIGYLFAKYSILFTANQEYGFVRKIQGLGRILFQIIQVVLLIKIHSFTIFILIMILENLFSYYFYQKHYKMNYSYVEKVEKREKKIFNDMKNLFWHKIGGVIVYNTDYILLSKFVSLSVVGIYSSYLMVYQIIATILNILTPVLTPKIGLFVAKNSKTESYEFWKELNSLYFMLSTLFILCTYYLIQPFIKLWMGESYLLPKLTVVLILVNLFIHLTRGVTETFKNSFGYFDDTFAPALESGINFVISLILVLKIGLNGVIIGTVFSNIIVILLLKPILVFRRCFEKKAIEYLKNLIHLFLLSGTSIVLVELLIKNIGINYINLENWIEFIYKAFQLGIITVIVVFIIFLFDNSFRKLIFKIYKNKN